jgi:hypothetical protein
MRLVALKAEGINASIPAMGWASLTKAFMTGETRYN